MKLNQTGSAVLIGSGLAVLAFPEMLRLAAYLAVGLGLYGLWQSWREGAIVGKS